MSPTVIAAIAGFLTIAILCTVISICACSVAGNADRNMGEK